MWLVIVIFIVGYYFYNTEFFKPENFKNIFVELNGYALCIYIIISMLRGFTMIPSTVFIFSGVLLFSPVKVFTISIIGILFSATMVYFFSRFLGFDKYFEKRYSKRIDILRSMMKKRGFLIVAFWSFFPSVPTDLICYIGGTLKMKYWKYILAVAVGEIPLVFFYVFIGSSVYEVVC